MQTLEEGEAPAPPLPLHTVGRWTFYQQPQTSLIPSAVQGGGDGREEGSGARWQFCPAVLVIWKDTEQIWWFILLIPGLGRLRQEDCYKFEGS